MEQEDKRVRPSYYKSEGGSFEVIDVIEQFALDFNLGQVCKYICRAGKKEGNGRRVDLAKALWYLQRELRREE